jgi:hypothetical protein
LKKEERECDLAVLSATVRWGRRHGREVVVVEVEEEED